MATITRMDASGMMALSTKGDSGRSSELGADADLASVASMAEQDPLYWRREFEWALEQRAVAALAGVAGSRAALTAKQLAAQHAICYRPRGAGDEGLEAELAALGSRLTPRINSGADVCVDLSDAVRSGRCPETLAAAAASLLPSALRGRDARAGRLSFSFRVGTRADLALLDMRHSVPLGNPLVLARLDNQFFRRLGIKDPEVGRVWGLLTELAHRDRRVVVIPEFPARSPCALCGPETPNAVLPGSRLETRADTAWIALAVRVDKLFIAFERQPDALRRIMRAGLRLLDNLPEQIPWPTPGLQRDAIDNRRLAIHLVGAGRLVDQHGLDPGDFTTLRRMTRWFTLLQRLAVRESATLASTRGPFPALDAHALVDALARRYGQARAHELIRRRSLRHRHLVALSPFSVIPERDPRHPAERYLHLLPAVRGADSICFQGDSARRWLDLSAYRRLLRMAWAMGQSR